MAGKMLAPPKMSWEQEEKLYSRAREKAHDVNFTTRDNPLAYLAYTTPEQAYAQQRISENMESLRIDARRRSDPANGRIYAGIMDMRYGG